MTKFAQVKAVVPAFALSLLLAACAVPPALMPEREMAATMPVEADGSTLVTGTVTAYEGPAGTLDFTARVRGRDSQVASGSIAADGSFALRLFEPPAEALIPVREAWVDAVDIVSSNSQARLAFLYAFSVHEGRERPSGFIGMTTRTDPDEEYIYVGDMEGAYVYSSQPTRIRINNRTDRGGHRYVSDLNLAQGWNRVVTTVGSITADVVTYREAVDYSTDVPWAYVENED